MTQIFVAVPLISLEDRIESSVVLGQIIKNLEPSLDVQSIVWHQIHTNQSKETIQNAPLNKCVIHINPQSQINYTQTLKKARLKKQLQTTLQNIKQDLQQLMKAYQTLKRQNLKLVKNICQHKKEKQSSDLGLSKSLNIIQKDGTCKVKESSLCLKQNGYKNEQPLSISLQVDSKINSEKQRHLQVGVLQSSESGLRKQIQSLQRQISQLTRQNLQLKNVILYYESRLQFVGDYLKKLDEEKEKQTHKKDKK